MEKIGSTQAIPVFLITIDSLRSDHIGCYNYERNTTPNIDNIASEGATFLQAISHGGATPEAFPSILASIMPPSHPNLYLDILRKSITLAQILKNCGYDTAAFHSNPYLSRYFHYDKGFGTFEDSIGVINAMRRWRLVEMLANPGSKYLQIMGKIFGLLGAIHHPIFNADVITEKAISWLDNKGNNVFLWLHYMDIHHPYMPPSKYIKEFRSSKISRYQMMSLYKKMLRTPDRVCEAENRAIIDLYDASIRRVDEAIGRLAAWLDNKFRNSIILITADHGDEFGEHGTFSHLTTYEKILRVPLILKAPGIKPGITIHDQVSHIDIAPTIIDILNLSKVDTFEGYSLLPITTGAKKPREGVISVLHNYTEEHGKRTKLAYRTEKWKYICNLSLDESQRILCRELYDITKDPEERMNLLKEDNDSLDRAQQFDNILSKYLSQVCIGRETTEVIAEKQRIKQRVKTLKTRSRNGS